MTLVCLWNPAAGTAAASAELASTLLTLAPRIRADRAGMVWADARGLEARGLASGLLALIRERGGVPRAGISVVPVAAEIAAVYGSDEITVVEPGAERAFLAPWPLAVLAPPKALMPALEATGLECCGDLAALELGAVEVRFGSAGAALWRRARGEDIAPLFAPMARPLPSASLEWSDYVLDDPERLLFILNRLTGSVSAALRAMGQGAERLALVFTLAGGGSVEQGVQPSRPSADGTAWMRLLRDTLERVRLDDGIVGLALRVDAVGPTECVQGDVLDRGFASAGAAEAALARVLDRDGSVVTPHNSRHPLIRRRTEWVEEPSSFVWARPQIGAGDTEPEIALHLLPEPELVEAETAARQGFAVPVRYRDAAGWQEIVAASGPDCLSGGQWDTAYAYEAYCCVRRDGELVQLCRDARRNRWEVHGLWR
ncbi:MAG: hypothetical protein ACM357_07945 [Gemmatimonadota bacterium]